MKWPQTNRTIRGLAWAFGASIAAGGFMVPWKAASAHGEPQHLVLVMLTVATLLNMLILPLMRGEKKRLHRTAFAVASGLAMLTLVGNLAAAAAIARISGPLLSVLQRTEVIMVALIAWIFIGERVDRWYWLGALISLVGIWLLQSGGSDKVTFEGILFGLFSAACFSTMIPLTRHYIDRIDPLTVNAIRLILSVLFWFVVYGPPPPMETFNNELLLYGTLAAILGPWLGRTFIMYSSRYIESRISALVLLCAPFFTLVLSWLILDSWPSAKELYGGGIMLIGIAIPLIAMLRHNH
jgi:drug/metabolite transporter (DMT)-like permease